MDPVHQQFLRLAYEKAQQTERDTVNGIAIYREMGLHRNDYIRMIDRLQDAGYVKAPGSNAQHVTLTDYGMRQAQA